MSKRKNAKQGRKIKPVLFSLLGGLTVLGAVAAIRFQDPAVTADAAGNRTSTRPTQTTPAIDSSRSQPRPYDAVAVVDGQKITREHLANECLKHYGKQVLESLMNKYLIQVACQEQNIQITADEVNAEIQRIAASFKIPVDQYMLMLQNEREITPAQYASEIIWPTLALKKLAADRIIVTEEEVKAAMLTRFGPQVKARLLLVKEKQLAQELRTQLIANPNEFARLAREHSTDVNSASAGGMIQPIRRNVGEIKIEKAAFSMRTGDISEIIPVGNQFVLLKCEGYIEGHGPSKTEFAHTEKVLIQSLKDSKLRETSKKFFKELKGRTEVVNVMGDPVKSKQMPNVVATINGQPISVDSLKEQCLARHGKEVLEGSINRKLLELALSRKQTQVTQADIDAEVARAAKAAGVVTGSGQPNLQKWVEMVTQQQDITPAIYLHDIVWPSVALKKIVSKEVVVTEEDLQKSFEANYGPRVRCRVIMMNNRRKAQEVWDMARQNRNIETFGKLAEQYSVDPSGAAIGGEVPPIQKHGGQSVLEREAFSLKPGDISGVIQLVGGRNPKFVILFCEGITKPVVVEMADVKDILYEDLFEKKHRVAMAKEFQKLQERATIKNLLDPSKSRTPQAASLKTNQRNAG